ncbi:alkaline-phosphatase-like protein [Dipodascopsis uninucleata]
MKFFSSLFLTAAVLPLIQAGKPKNYIFVLPDGYGPASEVFARDFASYKNNGSITLPVDDLAIGYVRTKASDTLVTDSAAAATAYACGIKTYNGAIGVDDDYQPCGTILEAAKLEGYMTGLVVTSRITHASPAGFASHTYFRDLESDIAEQLVGYSHPLGRVVDVIMGGGRCFFLPKSDPGSCRKDELDLWSIARDDIGWDVATSREEFDDLRNGDSESKRNFPFMFLPTLDHMSYEADRDSQDEPSLTEMTETALEWLHRETKHSDKGFFLFVEASRIDHAGHAHDPIGHLHDILEYNRAMNTMKQFIDDHPDTALLSAADHECGGLTLGVPDYAWYPEVLAKAKHTTSHYLRRYEQFMETNGNYTQQDLFSFLAEMVFAPYGILNPTKEELRGIFNADSMSIYLGEVLSARAGINWSTLGHTAVDVTLFGYGKNTEKMAGSFENIDVNKFMRDQLNLSLVEVTQVLQANTTWVKSIGPNEEGEMLVKRYQLAHDHEHSINGHDH